MATRTYGHDKTIHQTTELDVEVDGSGRVVAVWFRCQPLPFRQAHADRRRALEMIGMYDREDFVKLVAVELDQ